MLNGFEKITNLTKVTTSDNASLKKIKLNLNENFLILVEKEVEEEFWGNTQYETFLISF